MLDPANRAQRVKQVFTDLDRRYEEEETQKKAEASGLGYVNLQNFPL